MKGLRFANTQESCFETSKRSHMCCAALLCGRFGDIQELRFKPEKRSDMDSAELQGDLFPDCQEWYFQAAKVQIRAVPSCKWVDLLIRRNRVFRVRNVEIWAVLSNNC